MLWFFYYWYYTFLFDSIFITWILDLSFSFDTSLSFFFSFKCVDIFLQLLYTYLLPCDFCTMTPVSPPFLNFFNPNCLSIQRLAALMRLLFGVLFLVIRCLIAPFTCRGSSTDLSWSTFLKIMPSLVCPYVINLFTSPMTSCSSGVLSNVLLTAVEILAFLTSFTSTSTFNLANISSLWLMPLTFCCAFLPYIPSSLLLMASNLNLMFKPSFSHFYDTFLA